MDRLGICFGAFALMALAACQPKIGDPCKRSTDCSRQGERTCDLSNRVNGSGIRTPSGSGECTIEGCGRGDCPGEAACVKVYGSDFLSVACDPTREDQATVGPRPGCDDDVCVPLNDCEANEVCLPEGLCADEVTARTSCRRKCGNSGDCRNGYECVVTGARGFYLAPDLENPSSTKQKKICVPLR